MSPIAHWKISFIWRFWFSIWDHFNSFELNKCSFWIKSNIANLKATLRNQKQHCKKETKLNWNYIVNKKRQFEKSKYFKAKSKCAVFGTLCDLHCTLLASIEIPGKSFVCTFQWSKGRLPSDFSFPYWFSIADVRTYTHVSLSSSSWHKRSDLSAWLDTKQLNARLVAELGSIFVAMAPPSTVLAADW